MQSGPPLSDLDREDPANRSVEIDEVPGDRIFNEMCTLIGEMPPGSKLPSERELMERYAISRQTARRVLNRLTTAGLVNRKVGSGTFVKEHGPDPEPGNEFSDLDAGLSDVLEARRGLDPLIVELATERASPRDIERMQRIIDKLLASTDQADMKRHSYDFLMALATASRNPVLRASYQILVQCRVNLGWDQLKWQQSGENSRSGLVKRQTELFEAIKKRDRFTAVSLVLKDLERLHVLAMGPRVQQTTLPDNKLLD